MVSERDKYLFDLKGFIVLRKALDAAEVGELNDALDAIPRLAPGLWYGAIHGHTCGTKDGLNYQQIYEGGEPFERLVGHPAWIEHMKTFVGQHPYDCQGGTTLFIDENFANFRDPGEAIGMHSGGDIPFKRSVYGVQNGQFMCMMVNARIALTDIGPGDGATMVIPGSHKQNFPHPDISKHIMSPGASGDYLEEAVEVHLKAGDVLIFSDRLCHGSAKRVNPGQRRSIVYRYNPAWVFFRMGYRPSQELLDRLTPERRKLVWPHVPLERSPNLKPGIAPIRPAEKVNQGVLSGSQ